MTLPDFTGAAGLRPALIERPGPVALMCGDMDGLPVTEDSDLGH